MDYISQMSKHCSKGNLKCVHQCINLHKKEINCVIFQTNCYSIKEIFKKLGDGMQKKFGRNKHKFPRFDNDFLSSLNKIHFKQTDCIFQIKQDDICDYNPMCFMSSEMDIKHMGL